MEEHVLEQRTISFHGDTLLAIRTQSGIYMSIRSMCEALGIDDRGQMQRIGRIQDLAAGLRRYAVPTRGGPQHVSCLHEAKIAPWLGSIQARRLKHLRIEKLTLYQRELANALPHQFVLSPTPLDAQLVEPKHQTDLHSDSVPPLREEPPKVQPAASPITPMVESTTSATIEGNVISSESGEVLPPELKQRMITVLLSLPPPDVSSHMATTSSEVDRSLREATLAPENQWDISMHTPTFSSSNQLKVYLGTPQSPLELDEAQTKIRQLGASTVLTARIVMGLWNLRHHNSALAINGSAAVSVEEILAWRGLEKHHRSTYPASPHQRTDGYRSIHKQRLLRDLDLLSTCCVRGHYIAAVKGKQTIFYIDSAYLRYSTVTTPNQWRDHEVLGFFVSPGDWIISSDINVHLAEVDRRVFQLNPQNEMHELRLALYLVELWRQQVPEQQIDQPIRMDDLLQASMIMVDTKYMARFADRIEHALNRLWEYGILGEAPQCLTPVHRNQSRWSKDWLASHWRLVPPATIVECHATRHKQLRMLTPPKRKKSDPSGQ